MKKKIIAAVIGTIVVISVTAALGYASGCNLTNKKWEKNIEKMAQEYEERITELETRNAELEDIKKDKKASDPQKDPKAEKTKENRSEEEKGYDLIGFEDIFGPACTEAQLETIKEEAIKGIAKTEYESVKKISMSEYTQMDPEKGKLIGYARLDKKGVLKISYSIRYGKATAEVSDYTLQELKELEQYGRVMDVESVETVAPRPIETETPEPTKIQEQGEEMEEREETQEQELIEEEVPEEYEMPLS